MDRATYLKEIETAYQAEVRGEATFSTLAERATNPDEVEIWQTLARLEATTRARLIPLMQRHGIDTTPDEDQKRRGRERGEKRAAAGFSATVQSMTETLLPYLTLYAQLEAEGPAEDRKELSCLNAHEVALHEFATHALAGGGLESLEQVKAFLGERGQDAQRVKEILATIKPLAAEYYRLTGKPLGVTGEVAEYVAAELLGLELSPPRTQGYDAIRRTADGTQRIQIKGRAYGEDAKPSQKLGTIKRGAPCDAVLLVLLDNRTLEPREMWEAPIAAVEERLALPGSNARDRGALGVPEFKRLARQVWPNQRKPNERQLS